MLFLRHLNIGLIGCEFLKNMTTRYHTLNLESNRLGPANCKFLKDVSVHTLDLTYNNIGPGAVSFLMIETPLFTNLILSHNKIGLA